MVLGEKSGYFPLEMGPKLAPRERQEYPLHEIIKVMHTVH